MHEIADVELRQKLVGPRFGDAQRLGELARAELAAHARQYVRGDQRPGLIERLFELSILSTAAPERQRRQNERHGRDEQHAEHTPKPRIDQRQHQQRNEHAERAEAGDDARADTVRRARDARALGAFEERSFATAANDSLIIDGYARPAADTAAKSQWARRLRVCDRSAVRAAIFLSVRCATIRAA